MLNSYDILTITLVTMIIGIIIVINVKNSLNNKLSHVQVKIPDITVPSPKITVTVQKQCNKPDYDVFIDNGGTKKYSPNVGSIEKKHVENFESVSEESIDKTNNKENIVDYGDYLCVNKKFFLNNSHGSIKFLNDKHINDIVENDHCSEENYCNLDYYIKNKKIMGTSFEDGTTRGSNIDKYGNYGGLNDIGKINLSNNNIPYTKPSNYIFSKSEI